MTARWFASTQRTFWSVIVIAAAIKITLALCTFGTNDVLFFQAYAEKVKSGDAVGLYRDGVLVSAPGLAEHPEFFAHPPFIIHLLEFLNWVRSLTGLSFPLLFRLLSILADIGSAVVMRELLETSPDNRHPHLTACLFAAAPTMILVSGFHGNTDPLMIFFLILCVWLLSRRQAPWIAGLAFGMSCSIKIWPMLLAPVLVLYLPVFRQRFSFSSAALATFLVGGLPVVADAPVLVATHVFMYPSLLGHWGLSRLIPLTGSQALWLLYAKHGRLIMMGALAAATLLLHWKSKADLMVRIGVVASLFLVVTPGFGIQYLTWLLPWLTFLEPEAMLIYIICTSVFMFHVYTFWSNGLPWDLANSLVVGTWRGYLEWHELLCWLSVSLCLYLFLRKAGLTKTPAVMLAKATNALRQAVVRNAAVPAPRRQRSVPKGVNRA